MSSMNLGALNLVDILILAIFLISILIGFGRGLVSEVLSLATLIAAFVIAIMFSNTLATFFTSTAAAQSVVSSTTAATGVNTATPVSYVALGVSFGVLFGATVIVGSLIKMVLNLFFNTGILGFGNRILGALFGLIRGYLLNLVLIFLVQLSPVASQPWWQQSHYVPMFQPQVVQLGNLVSPALSNLKSTFGSAIQNANTAIQEISNNIQK